MEWHKDILRGFRDNAAYEGGRYVVLLVWPFILSGIYWLLAKFDVVPWSTWANAGLLLIAVIILCVTASKLVRRHSPEPATVGLSGKLDSEGETDGGDSWTALHKQVIENARDSAREAAVRTENERRDRARAISDLVDRAEERITKDKINYPLFALQRAGAALLHTEQEFLDACEALHHRHFAHPLKSFKDTQLDWLKFVRFANNEEVELSNDTEVYQCLVRFRSLSVDPQVAAPTEKTGLERHQEWEKDQAEKGISIHLPRSFTPPTTAQRQELAELKQKLVNSRAKGKKVAEMPEPPAGFDYPRVILGTLRDNDALREQITQLEDAQRNPNAPLRSLHPIDIRDLVDGLIADGKLLVKLWKTRLESDSASQRCEQSMKWLSIALSTVREHLTIQQFDELRLGEMNENDRIDMVLKVMHAGSKQGSEDYELALAVANKVEMLQQLRSKFK